jgi:FecR protein
MRRSVKVQVEPLSEPRWAKVERALFAQVDAGALEKKPTSSRPARHYSPLAWASAAAVLGIIVVAMVGSRLWRAREVLANPSRISTGVLASHLALPGVSLDVQPESAVVISGETGRTLLIVVDRGEIACDVEHRDADAPLIVQAGGVRVKVVGTRFSVTRQGENARVDVQKGVVEVTAGGQSVRVAAGETWPHGSAAPVSSGAAVTLPSEPSGSLPAPPAESPPGVVDARDPRGPQRSGRHLGTTAPLASDSDEHEAAARRTSPSQELFEAATRAEASDPGRAIGLYRTVETGRDSWAQNALFAHARLEATRGNKAEAGTLLRQYLARFPRGPNADDARAVLERLR